MNRKSMKLVHFVIFFDNLFMLNISFGAGATSRYGSGSTKMMQLLAASAPAPAQKHCLNLKKQQNLRSNFWIFLALLHK
jgi:hypothetical protein